MNYPTKSKEELILELQKLQFGEAQKNAILNGITANIAFVDKDLKIIWANKTAAESVKKSPDEMIGHSCHYFWADPSQPCKNCPSLKALDTKKSEQTIIHTPDGRVWEERGEPVFDAEGILIGVVEIATDITGRIYTEKALRENEERYRSLLMSLDYGIIVHAPDSSVVMNNARASELFGLSDDQMKGKTAIDPAWKFLNENKTPLPIEDYPVNRILNGKKPIKNQLLGIHQSGTNNIVWVTVNGYPVLNNSGFISEIVISFIDVTERKILEDAQTFLLHCGYPGSDEDFFESLARYLAQSLSMEYVCIDRLEGDGLTAQTVAIYNDGKFDTNVSYALKETPCGDVLGKTICCFPADVCKLFPHDAALQDLQAVSYIGTTLFSFDRTPIGLIAVIGRNPLKNPGLAEALLKMVAVRAAGELDRKQAEQEIK